MTTQETRGARHYPASESATTFVLWRFLLVVMILVYLGVGFWFLEPKPQQQLIFFSLLVLVFYETSLAGWYRGPLPQGHDASSRNLNMPMLVGYGIFLGGILLFALGASCYIFENKINLKIDPKIPMFLSFIALAFGFLIVALPKELERKA